MKQIAKRALPVFIDNSLPAASPSLAGRFPSDLPCMDEPELAELLNDPILLRLMRSDGVEMRQLQLILKDARARLLA